LRYFPWNVAGKRKKGEKIDFAGSGVVCVLEKKGGGEREGPSFLFIEGKGEEKRGGGGK